MIPDIEQNRSYHKNDDALPILCPTSSHWNSRSFKVLPAAMMIVALSLFAGVQANPYWQEYECIYDFGGYVCWLKECHYEEVCTKMFRWMSCEIQKVCT